MVDIMNESRPGRPFLFAALVGIFGGGALILTTILTRRGQTIFLPYGGLIAAMALYLYSRRVASFGARFGASLGAFMLATIIMYSYLVTIVNPRMLRAPLWRNVWPLGVFLLIGSAVSAVVAKATPARPVVAQR
jgi:uncharacterized membrane protein YfcA